MQPRKFDKQGREIPDSTPMAIPVGFKRPESLQAQIARMVRRELSDAAALHGDETEEEANDFDIPDSEPEGFSTRHELLGDEYLGEEHEARAFADRLRAERDNGEDEPDSPRRSSDDDEGGDDDSNYRTHVDDSDVGEYSEEPSQAHRAVPRKSPVRTATARGGARSDTGTPSKRRPGRRG